MPSLADLMEDYRNWKGRGEWEQAKGWQDFYGGDFEAQERAEKFGGFGTDAGGLVGMIKASHGSPHAFTKFLMSKLGTGEGAQAYGHGMYFGEGFDSPVAKKYAEDLGSLHSQSFNKPSGEQIDLPPWAVESIQKGWQTKEEIANQFRDRIQSLAKSAEGSPQPWIAEDQIKNLKGLVSALDDPNLDLSLSLIHI